MHKFKLADLIYADPSGPDVMWEGISEEEWFILKHYRGENDSVYLDMNLEEQFMFLCFVVLAEKTK